MHKAVQFSNADRVGSRSAILACLTGIWVTSRSGILSVTQNKRVRSKARKMASSTGWEAFPTIGVMLLTKSYSF